MAIYSFKSAGKTSEQKLTETLSTTAFPIGVKTPLEFNRGEQDDLFVMNYRLEDQIGDNFRNMIQTNWGERLCLYDFGANLRPLMTELVSQDDFDSAAIERISNATSKWMPYINLGTFSSSIDRDSIKNTAIIKLTITYDIPSINVMNKVLEVTFYAI